MQGSSLIEIILNGESKALAPGQSVAALLAGLALDQRKVAVERNGAIVPRSQHAHTVVEPGDRLEIVQFIGGG